MNAEQLIGGIAAYKFECEAGPLHLCVDYQKLCALALLAVTPQPQAPSSDDVQIGLLDADRIAWKADAMKQAERAEKAEAALADARNSALEEAAKVCDDRFWDRMNCAPAIRALRTTSEK
jgi:hypothetical protein